MKRKKKQPPKMFPLLCWDIAAQGMQKLYTNQEVRMLTTLAAKLDWKIDIPQLMQKPHEAIVVTDLQQRIYWASPGFLSMTGYTPTFARNKRPAFLQGRNTSTATRAVIRQAIAGRQPIRAALMNYRKDGTEYLCEVDIQPISNSKNIVTHFIAFEREVPVPQET
jgi:PAS domain S-box-containing protein